MKQVAQTLRDGEIRVADTPAPSLRSGGVLVRNAFSLISAGTERAKVELARKSLVGKAQSRPDQAKQVLAMFREQSPTQIYTKVMNRLSSLEPLGYSCSGEVIAVGNDVDTFRVGDLVACAGSEYANHAEVIFVPKNLCIRLPRAVGAQQRAVTLEEGTFATVGAIALHGLRQADVRLGETVIVIGLGLVGLLAVQLARASGCRVIGLDPIPGRCELAKSLGCCVAATDHPQILAELNGTSSGIGADAIILAAASQDSQLMTLAGELCRQRGRVVVVGDFPIEIPRNLYYHKELEVRLSRSYGPGRYDHAYEEAGHDYPFAYVRWTENRNMDAFLKAVASDSVALLPLITHRFAVERAPEAYDMILEGREPSLGVLLEYPAPAPQPEATKLKAAATAHIKTSSRLRAESIGIGLLGAGNFAQDVLLPVLKASSDVHLKCVVTQSGLHAHDVAKRFGFDRCSTDFEEILADATIQAVVIATRHDTHAPFTLRALQAGKSVFVEKPLAVTPEQLHELAEFCGIMRESSPFVMVGFNRRFSHAIREARQFLSAVNEPLVLNCRVNAGRLPLEHWLHDPIAGGGRIVGEGCHFVDLLLFVVGALPTEVHARTLPACRDYHDDNVIAQIGFSNGSVGTFTYVANGDKRTGKEYLEIFGGGATVIVDDFRRTILSRHGIQRQIGHRWSKQDKGHRSELRAFIDAVRHGLPSPTPFDELLAGAKATFSILASLRSGQTVRINEIES